MRSSLALLALLVTVFLSYCAAEGILFAHSCSLGLALDILRGADRWGATCKAVPLTMDIPSLALGIAIAAAAMAHVWYVAMLREFPVLLASDQVVSLRGGTLTGSTSLFMSSLPSGRVRVILLVGTVGIGILFYVNTLHYGYYFDQLAAGQDAPTGVINELESAWWANFHAHPLAALVWIGTGVTGTYVGVLDLWSYVRLTRRLDELEASPHLEIDYVLDHESPSLTTLTRLEDLKIWAMLIFAVTVVAVGVLARNPDIVAVNNAGIAVILAFFTAINAHGYICVRGAKRDITDQVKTRVDLVATGRRAALRASPAPPEMVEVVNASYAVGVSMAKRSIDLATSKSTARRAVNVAGAALTLYVTVLGVVPAATF